MTMTLSPQAQTVSAPKVTRAMPAAVRRALLGVLLLIAWQIVVWVGNVSPLLMPAPLDVGQALVEDVRSGELLTSTGFTLKTLVIGTVIGMAIGLTLATLAVLSRWMHDFLTLIVSVLNPLPSIAILPLAMIWFGLTQTAIIVVILNSTIWPIALNADMGFRTISQTLQRAARTLGVRGFRMVSQVLLPAALPHLLTGIRIAWAFGWRTVVAAELVFGVAGGSGGIGYYINQSRYFLDTANVFAGLVVISMLGLLIEAGFGVVERRTIERWGMTKAS